MSDKLPVVVADAWVGGRDIVHQLLDADEKVVYYSRYLGGVLLSLWEAGHRSLVLDCGLVVFEVQLKKADVTRREELWRKLRDPCSP